MLAVHTSALAHHYDKRGVSVCRPVLIQSKDLKNHCDYDDDTNDVKDVVVHAMLGFVKPSLLADVVAVTILVGSNPTDPNNAINSLVGALLCATISYHAYFRER